MAVGHYRQKVMNRNLANVSVVFLVWYFCCGCVTKSLWEDKAFNEPSPQPNLQLYYSETKRDVLVVYDEIREPWSSVYRRGYFLNDQRGHNEKPVFVDVRATNQLRQIPVVAKAPPHLARAATNSFAVLVDPAKFSVTVNGEQTGIYELPVYSSGFHQGTQIALTPAAVLADTVIIGSVVGAVVAYWVAAGQTSGYNPSY
jgi:hypothetical protein